MEATILSHGRSPFAVVHNHRRYTQKSKIISPRVVCVATQPSNNTTDARKIEITTSSSTSNTTTYNDNWLERIAINHLSHTVQASTGMKNDKSGYEGLVEATKEVYKNFNPTQQEEIVTKSLEMTVPAPILFLIRAVMPPSKFAREYFAAFTTVFFPWLVGPCEVRASEFNGEMEKNVVHIKKCRFLEGANCVGMCTNLCKVPSQAFIKRSFGMPVTMVPNFDDMSCEMVFGQEPPAKSDDPAFKEPCYKLCNVKKKHSTSCIDQKVI